MNKKILALALAIVFIATAFTACKKGPELTDVNGMELPLETDKSGETIINEDNQIAVLVTDRDNEVITHANGENQTHWVQINGALVVKGKLQTKEYSINILEGWEGNSESGRVVKQGTDEKCYIQFNKIKKLDMGETLDTYLETIDAQNTAIAEAFQDEEQMNALMAQNPAFEMYKGCKYTVAESAVTIGGAQNGQSRVHKIVDKDGKLIHYAENYYFIADKSIYKIDYICEEGKGYDESFIFSRYMSENITINVKD